MATLRNLDSFVLPRRLKVFSKLLLEDCASDLEKRAVVIGAYFNDESDVVFFTSQGFYQLIEEKIRYTNYESIFSIALPEGHDDDIEDQVDQNNVLTITLHDGTKVPVPIKNETDESPDFYTVYSFLVSRISQPKRAYSAEDIQEIDAREDLINFLKMDDHTAFRNERLTDALESGFPENIDLLDQFLIDPELLERPDVWRLLAILLKANEATSSTPNPLLTDYWDRKYFMVGDENDEEEFDDDDDDELSKEYYLPNAKEIPKNLIAHLNDQVLEVLAFARDAARRRNKASIGPEFILLSLAARHRALCNSVLNRSGMSGSNLREELIGILGETTDEVDHATFSVATIHLLQQSVEIAKARSMAVTPTILLQAIRRIDSGLVRILIEKFEIVD